MSNPTHKNLTALIEQPDSRRRENGDTVTETRVYIADYDTCKAAQKTKNTAGTGDLTGYVIRTSSVEPIRGLAAKLIDVWQAGGDDADPEDTPLPADEVSVTPSNLAPKTERHPKFLSLGGIDGELANVEDALRGSTAAIRNAAYALLSGAGKELVDLIRAGNESFYLASLRYTWATHFYTVPSSYRGGWVEAPGGPLAGYFVGGISWLREGDDLQYSNGIWRLTRSWLGGPMGGWNNRIYPV